MSSRGSAPAPTQETGPSLGDLISAFQKLNQQDDFNALSHDMLQAAAKLFAGEAAALLLVNKMTGELEIGAVAALPEEVIAEYAKRPARAEQVAKVYATGADPFQLKPDYPPLAAVAKGGCGYSSMIPIRIQDKVIGYLTLANDRPLLVTGEAQKKALLFVEYMAQGIENAYFIYQLRQQNARLELMMTRLQNAQAHLKRAEKMALVGKIAASVAHEIRNPLTVIGTSLQWVREKMKVTDPNYALFEQMLGRVRGVDQTIKELLAFARPLKIEVKPLKAELSLARVMEFIKNKFEAKDIRIDRQIQAGLPLVLADEEQIQRIWLNLFLNAYEFLPQQGAIFIRASHHAQEPWVNFYFADNGPGIAPENLPQIFEPFFTTRTDGNGLGLFLVKYLLEEMNASIEVTSVTGQGTEFLLRLPLAESLQPPPGFEEKSRLSSQAAGMDLNP